VAKTKEISAFVGRKVNDGNYGSVTFEAGEVVTIEKGDDREVEYEKMHARCMKRLFSNMLDQGIEP